MENTIEKLRDYFNKIGVSQTEVADRLGVTKAYINAIFTGRRNIGKKIADKMEKELGISSVYLLTGKGNLLLEGFETETEVGLPLIPISAVGGALTGTDAQFMEYDTERYFIPAFRKSDFLIRVDGDSMYPKYQKGDIVACTRVPLNDIWFQWGKVYVIDTRQGALIKYVEPGSNEGCITLASENQRYKPFSLPMEEVNGVAIVNGLIRVE